MKFVVARCVSRYTYKGHAQLDLHATGMCKVIFLGRSIKICNSYGVQEDTSEFAEQLLHAHVELKVLIDS